MATPGHPFLTEGLDDLRAEQRRQLRFLDDFLVEDAERLPRPHGEKGPDAPFLESVLRDIVREDAAGEDLADHLEEMRQRRAGDWIAGLERAWPTSMPPTWDLRAAVEDFRRKLLARVPSGEPTILSNDYRRLVVLGALLIWADELADDGYSDPRLTGAGQTGG